MTHPYHHKQHASVIILAVKPDVVPQVLRELSQRVTRHHLIISIAAGVTLQLLQHVRLVVSHLSFHFFHEFLFLARPHPRLPLSIKITHSNCPTVPGWSA